MNSLFVNLIEITTVFSVLYVLYLAFLNTLTFHNINRLVLLSLMPISIIIPFLDTLFPSFSSNIIDIPLYDHIPLNAQLEVIEEPLTDTSFNTYTVLNTIYWFVFSMFLLRIFNTAKKLALLKNNSIIQQKNGYKLIIANVPEIFSYFNWVFIPQHKSEQYDHNILAHEKVHIQLKHSWDVILAEVFIAFFWFNPLLYSYRKSLKSVHEFQADTGVLLNGIKTSQYMQLLMESLQINRPNNLYNYFNQSILKKRVIMMTKPKSKPLSKLKYFLILPVSAFLISAFTPSIHEDDKFLNLREVKEFITIPPSLFPVKNATKDDISSYFGIERKHPKTSKKNIHNGIDIKATPGTPVLATADGIIAKAEMEGNWGNLIIVTHTDGYETWYAHLKGFNIIKNQEVKKGDVIGYVGSTGLSTGPHLHYEVKQNGKHVNPLGYLE